MKGQFSAANLSSAARRAAYALGMRTVRSYDILCHSSLEKLENTDRIETPVLELHNAQRSLILTAGDLIEAIRDLEPSAEPMARVR